MTVIEIDETTEAGRRILRELARNPEAGKTRDDEIPRDENGEPIGFTPEEVFAEVDKMLSEAYGVDFALIRRLIDSGELNEEELTDEWLLAPEFKYEPYPGFRPEPLSPNFKPDPQWQISPGDPAYLFLIHLLPISSVFHYFCIV